MILSSFTLGEQLSHHTKVQFCIFNGFFILEIIRCGFVCPIYTILRGKEARFLKVFRLIEIEKSLKNGYKYFLPFHALGSLHQFKDHDP